MSNTNAAADPGSVKAAAPQAEPTGQGALATKLQGMDIKDQAHSETPAQEDGPIETSAELQKDQPREPYPLIDGFEWASLDLTDETDKHDLHQLLQQHYCEDEASQFRSTYSASFLAWALSGPGRRSDCHVGVRATQSRRLVAFVTGVPITCRVRDKTVVGDETSYFCIHKKLRSKRLAPLLLLEGKRRGRLGGSMHAIYTGRALRPPTPLSTCQYYHRSLNWEKLHEVGFTILPPGATVEGVVQRLKLPEKTVTPKLRPMKESDVSAVSGLLNRYLERFQLAREFSEEETKYWMLGPDPAPEPRDIYSYVVEQKGKITDFFSWFRSETTAIQGKENKIIHLANLFYYATDVALEASGDKAKTLLQQRLTMLMEDALVLAQKEKFDVFNALTNFDNPLFLRQLKFRPGNGKLHYWISNYRASPISGGLNSDGGLDERLADGVGLTLLG